MAKRTGRLLTATLAAGLVLSVGGAALAAPVGGLKQYKVPTANSEPRDITNGADGNRWFTEGTDSTLRPAKSDGSRRAARSPSLSRPWPTGAMYAS